MRTYEPRARPLVLVAAVALALLCQRTAGIGLPGISKDVKLKKVANCETECKEAALEKLGALGNDDDAFYVRNMTVSRVSRTDYAVSGYIVVKTELKEPVGMFLKVRHCESDSNTETCSDLLETMVPDICPKLRQKNSPDTPMLDYLEDFERKCPIAPGEYFLNKFVVDSSEVSMLCPLQGYYRFCAAIKAGDDSGCMEVAQTVYDENI